MKKISYKTALPVLLSKEDGMIVAYTPALNLGSCGRTQPEAVKRLSLAIELFFSELIEMGTLEQALKELGWRPVGNHKFCPANQPTARAHTKEYPDPPISAPQHECPDPSHGIKCLG